MATLTLLWNLGREALSDGGGERCALVMLIWLLYRQKRCFKAVLARQQQHTMRLVNATWKTAFETMLREQPRRLNDLVEDIENDFSHKP